MDEKLFSDKAFRIMFFIMLFALVILALKPSKMVVLGSANDNQGDIIIDSKPVNNKNS